MKHPLKVLTLTCLLLVPGILLAQTQSETDSLVKKLSASKPHSTERVRVLNELGLKFAKSDSAKAFQYASEAKTISEKIGHVPGQAVAFRVFGIALTQKNRIPAAIASFNKAVNLYNSVKQEAETGVLFSDIGTAWLVQNNRKEAIESFLKAEQVHRRHNDQRNLLTDLNQLGVSYYQGNNTKKAVEYYVMAASLADKLGDRVSTPLIYNNLGQLLSEDKNYTGARDYFTKAITLNRQNNDQRNLGISILNLANTYTNTSDYKQAVIEYNNALEAFTKSNFTKGIQVCYNNLGAVALRQERFLDAIPLLNNSLAISESTKNYTGVALTQQNIAYAYTKLKQFDQAGKLFDEAEASAKKNKNNSTVFGEIYNHRSMLDSARGDFRNAFEQRNKYLQIKDSLLNEKLSKQINELQTQYETEKKERRIDALSQQNAVQALNLKNKELQLTRNKLELSKERLVIDQNKLRLANQQSLLNQKQIESQRKDIIIARKSIGELNSKAQLARNRRIVIGLAATLLAALAIFILISRNLRLQRKRLRAEKDLAEFKAEQELLNEKLRISSELHDNIGSQLTFLHYSIQHLRNKPENVDEVSLKDTEDMTVNTIRDLRQTVWFINATSLTAADFIIRLREYVKPYLAAGSTEIVVENEVAAEISMSSAVATNLFRITQEAITNAIKYASAGRITVTLRQTGTGQLTVNVTDNGCGFNTEQKSTGFGLKSMEARAKKSGGVLQVISAPEEGTSISISLPITTKS